MFDYGKEIDEDIKSTEDDIFMENNVNIIDFGFAFPFIKRDGSGEHLEK